MVILAEEMTVDLLTSEEKDIAVVSDGAVSLVGVVKMSTLSFSLHWANNVRQSKEREKLLGKERASERERE